MGRDAHFLLSVDINPQDLLDKLNNLHEITGFKSIWRLEKIEEGFCYFVTDGYWTIVHRDIGGIYIGSPIRWNYFLDKFETQLSVIAKCLKALQCDVAIAYPDYGASTKSDLGDLFFEWEPFKSIYERSSSCGRVTNIDDAKILVIDERL